MYATAVVMIISVGLVTFMQREVPLEISFKEPSSTSLIVNEINREIKEEKAAVQPMLDNIETSKVMDKILLKKDANPAPQKKTNILPSVSSTRQSPAIVNSFQEQKAPASLIQREMPIKQKSIAEGIEAQNRPESEKNRFEFHSILPSQHADSIESNEIQSPPIADYTIDIKHTPVQSSKPGKTIVHTFSISHESTFDDVYSIELLSNNPWIDKQDIPEKISIASNETYLLTTKSTIPTTATIETVLEIKLRVTNYYNKILSKEITTKTSIIN